MSDRASHPGACFCGGVRYRLARDPMFVHACHCRDCQRQTGGPFAVNALIEASAVEHVAGALETIVMPTDSGRPHDVARCPTCKSALWSDYGRRGWLLFVRAMTLEEPARWPPDAHIFTRSKLPYVVLPEGARAFEVYYDMKAEWPAESLARRAAAQAAAGQA